MAVARRHHYLPRGFLAAWTSTGADDGQLTVLDKRELRSWRTGPINAAIERDLYMLDIDEFGGEVASDAIEKLFAEVESRAIPILRALRSNADVIPVDGRAALMDFLSILAFRVPGRIDWIEQVFRAPIEHLFRMMVESGELPLPEDPIAAAQLRSLIDSDAIRVKINRTWLMARMLQGVGHVTALLAGRQWTVMRAAGDAGELLCSDEPVVLAWHEPVPGPYSPGFGLRNTVVFVPIGPTTALVGMWDAEPSSRVLTAEHVAGWNGNLLGSVHRFAFTRGDFRALRRDGRVDDAAAVLAEWKRASARTTE